MMFISMDYWCLCSWSGRTSSPCLKDGTWRDPGTWMMLSSHLGCCGCPAMTTVKPIFWNINPRLLPLSLVDGNVSVKVYITLHEGDDRWDVAESKELLSLLVSNAALPGVRDCWSLYCGGVDSDKPSLSHYGSVKDQGGASRPRYPRNAWRYAAVVPPVEATDAHMCVRS